MSARRAWAIARAELALGFKRPLWWVWALILVLTAWGMSTGSMQIQTGDSSVGGTKAWLSSEFSQSFQFAVIGILFYGFFVSVAAGMAILRDGESRVSELLHATPLRPGEYVWGKFLGLVLSFAAVGAIHVAANAFFNHVVKSGADAEYLGPFALRNYVRPALWFGAPGILFLAGSALAAGTLGRRPILIYFLPVALLLGLGFFGWTWKPHWLPLAWDRVMMALDPAGLRWLQRTWLDVDRGVDFYNTSAVRLDGLFVGSRLLFAAAGLLLVELTRWRLARGLRGAHPVRRGLAARTADPEPSAPSPLATLAMESRPSGFLAQVACLARVELRELRSSPGLYLFGPLILLQTVGTSFARTGAFDTPILWTSGLLAQASFNTLALLVCLLLLFYTVESLERERAAGLSAVFAAAPLSDGAVLCGKTLANAVLGAAILAASLAACAIVLLVQREAPLDVRPFALLWGLLLIPTFLLWNAFVACAWALVRNRYTTYAIGLGALMLSGWLQLTDRMNWVGNWNLWNAVLWSDLAPLELDRRAYVLNRVLALGGAAFLVALALRFLDRRETDAVGRATRRRPKAFFRAALALAPFAIVPAAAAIWLAFAVRDGTGGGASRKEERDYWAANLRTWVEAPQPAIAAAEVELELDPARSFLRSRGTFRLVNDEPEPLARFALTGGSHWENPVLALEDARFSYEHEEKSHLHVFRLERPLEPEEEVVLAFSFEGYLPRGISRNGPGASEFVLPGGAVLTSFTPSFVPVVGFLEGPGIEDENRYEPKDYPDDFYVGETLSGFGVDVPYPVKVTIRAPAQYTCNSVGVKQSDSVEDGMRTVRWESDRPVLFFNVVAGLWEEARAEGTVVYHAPEHAYNAPEIASALAAARRWYGEWFSPFPWSELKLSEFPGYAGYAQGFPTNITFSENIGFLTSSRSDADAPFLVTAHEAAHQWWGNRLVPGEGPGGNILSEGTSHFATILLFEQEKGLEARIGFCEGIETLYAERRQADSERPLVKIDGSRAGDETVTYDKGGWVFWMLLEHLSREVGRERALAGFRSFLEHYEQSSDHPVLQDFVEHLRPFALDAAAYDAFTRQWFFEVVVPEYQLQDARSEPLADGAWRVTARLHNRGTGTMPVAVAASRGERFPEEPSSEPPAAGYSDVRTTLTLTAGEEAAIELLCPFEPEELVVDPDALVLQLERKKARATLARP